MIGPHVIGIRQPIVIVKSMLHWEELFLVTKMPFAVNGRPIIFLFHQLAKSHFLLVNSKLGRMTGGSENPDSVGITSGCQCCSGCAANRLGDVKICELHSLAGQLVQVGSFEALGAKTSNICIALIVRKDDDEVGQFSAALAFCSCGGCRVLGI